MSDPEKNGRSEKRNSSFLPFQYCWSVRVVIALLVLASSGGCVKRRLNIFSNPPGAMVYIDNYEIGPTPVSTDFTYYGKRKFRLEKDGFETVVEEHFIPPPWYEWFPLEFVSENLYPGEIRDQRDFSFQLYPEIILPTEQILQRADGLRQASRTENLLGVPGLAPNPGSPMTLPPGGTPLAPAYPPAGIGQPSPYPPPGWNPSGNGNNIPLMPPTATPPPGSTPFNPSGTNPNSGGFFQPGSTPLPGGTPSSAYQPPAGFSSGNGNSLSPRDVPFSPGYATGAREPLLGTTPSSTTTSAGR